MSLANYIELLLVIVILVVLGLPLFAKVPQRKLYSEPDEEAEEYKHLQVRKEEVLLSIKELEIDFKVEKLSAEDYKEMRKKLEKEALVLLEKIEELEKKRKKARRPSKQVGAA